MARHVIIPAMFFPLFFIPLSQVSERIKNSIGKIHCKSLKTTGKSMTKRSFFWHDFSLLIMSLSLGRSGGGCPAELRPAVVVVDAVRSIRIVYAIIGESDSLRASLLNETTSGRGVGWLKYSPVTYQAEGLTVGAGGRQCSARRWPAPTVFPLLVVGVISSVTRAGPSRYMCA